MISGKDKEYLLKIARKALQKFILESKTFVPDDVPDSLKGLSATFVTLTVNDELRGCIGTLEAIEPLFQSIISNTVNAAVNDPRFARVSEKELGDIRIEISVLTKMSPLHYKDEKDLLSKLNLDGVFIEFQGRSATYLPQVWDQISDKREFMSSLCVKAGLPPHAWTAPGFRVFIYHVVSFKEGV